MVKIMTKTKKKEKIPKLRHDVDEKSFMPKKVSKFSARNKKQQLAYQTVMENAITFLIGAVGSGKTTIGCHCAFELLSSGEYKNIVLLRPVTTSKNQELGFLKGDLNEKIAPLLLPLKSVFEKIMGKEYFMSLVESEIIVPFAINYIEGMTYERSIILLDEFQNLDEETLRSILTRITDDSKVIVMGDRNQIKLPNPDISCSHTTDRFRNVENIGIIEFEEKDIVRGKITRIVESCYKNDSLNNNLFDSPVRPHYTNHDGEIVYFDEVKR